MIERDNSEKHTKVKVKLPFLVWLVAISTMVACIGGASFLGYNISGYAWLVPMSVSIIVFLKNSGKIYFPLRIWLPWICLVLVYLFFAEEDSAFQRSVMLLCPIFIGITVSGLNITDKQLDKFRSLYCYMAVTLYVVVLFKTGMLLTGTLPSATGLAPEVMTGALLCTLFAASYVFGKKRDLGWWGALAVIPAIALTRMGIFAAGLSLPLTFAPMKIMKRVIIIAAVVVVGLAMFQSERIQQKMFFSGTGTVEDVRFDNPDFVTTGRSEMWEKMRYGIEEKPWFGHGANAAGAFIFKLTGGLTHPHNDWLRLEYDYGYVGMVIFGLCLLMQMLHALKKARKSSGETRLLFLAGASAFLIFSLFMFTDNIILYVAFFGNFHFTILGLAYASYNRSLAKNNEEMDAAKKKRIRIKW